MPCHLFNSWLGFCNESLLLWANAKALIGTNEVVKEVRGVLNSKTFYKVKDCTFDNLGFYSFSIVLGITSTPSTPIRCFFMDYNLISIKNSYEICCGFQNCLNAPRLGCPSQH